MTMPKVQDTYVEDIEQFRSQPNNAATMGFQQTIFLCVVTFFYPITMTQISYTS